jgi:hypothetical protein
MAMGGELSPAQLRAVLSGDWPLNPYEYDKMAVALNERFAERGDNHPVPLSDELSRPADE